MRSLKIFGIILIVSILIFGVSCKLGELTDSDDVVKLAHNVEIIYERAIPCGDDEYSDNRVFLNIGIYGNAIKMEKIATDNFQYISPALEANVSTCIYVYDGAQLSVGGEEFTARIIRINGTELTDIRDDPVGNDYKVAYFTIREDGTVIP